ncbi:hypothetical protein [Nocardia sp. NPDC004260]
MVKHSAECQALLAELTQLAMWIDEHTDVEVREFLITVFDEDPQDSLPFIIGRRVWPTVSPAVKS